MISDSERDAVSVIFRSNTWSRWKMSLIIDVIEKSYWIDLISLGKCLIINVFQSKHFVYFKNIESMCFNVRIHEVFETVKWLILNNVTVCNCLDKYESHKWWGHTIRYCHFKCYKNPNSNPNNSNWFSSTLFI